MMSALCALLLVGWAVSIVAMLREREVGRAAFLLAISVAFSSALIGIVNVNQGDRLDALEVRMDSIAESR